MMSPPSPNQWHLSREAWVELVARVEQITEQLHALRYRTLGALAFEPPDLQLSFRHDPPQPEPGPPQPEPGPPQPEPGPPQILVSVEAVRLLEQWRRFASVTAAVNHLRLDRPERGSPQDVGARLLEELAR